MMKSIRHSVGRIPFPVRHPIATDRGRHGGNAASMRHPDAPATPVTLSCQRAKMLVAQSAPPVRRGERGAATVLVVLSLVALLGFAAMAIDLGFLVMKKSELQAAADAGALAGASALIGSRSDLTRVRNVAVELTRENLTLQNNSGAAITVAFLGRGGGGCSTDCEQVEVTVRNNAVELYLAKAFGVNSADISATARAEIYSVGGSKCLAPFALPAKFTWDDTCECSGKKNPPNACRNGELDTDSTCEMASIRVLGYSESDIGTQLHLKQDVYGISSWHEIVDFPPINKGSPRKGGAAYRQNIAGCDGSNNVLVEPGDRLMTEPGNKVGPTSQGVDSVIARDPGASWDATNKTIVGSLYADPMASPRVLVVALFDPRNPPGNGRDEVTVFQLGGVFLERTSGQDVIGRFVGPVAVEPGSSGEDGNNLLYGVRLVRDSSRGA